MQRTILNAYGITGEHVDVRPFGSGLINHTWMVKTGDEDFILQRINHSIFKQPAAISANISMTGNYLSQHSPEYLFVMPEKTLQGEEMLQLPGEGYFRLFRFVKNSLSIDVVHSPRQAFEAAAQFGRFTRLLADFPAEKLHDTLPDFHNLTLRYSQFELAVKQGNAARIAQAAQLIHFLERQKDIASTYEMICNDPEFKKRVTHHDTKISNVLFDAHDQGLCVIDLDTVMPGYFISDVGDMLRTYLCPVNEEEKDLSRISIRADYFKAIADGYLGQMKDELTKAEKEHFVYAGKFMIYMQALRFLTDHLNDDIYYGAKYEGHNFIRAGNQAMLLNKLLEAESELMQILRDQTNGEGN